VQFVVGPIVDALATLSELAQQIVSYLPGPASSALVSGSLGEAEGPGLHLLPWWAGGLVMLAYAVGLALIGWALTTRRDIS
jgi:ABC-2 type transport system permease protein